MLWALLITLLITKLAGGPEEIFMTPKLDKQIKSYVVDKDRSKEILLVAKDAKRELKTFGKLRKGKVKQIKEAGVSREVSSDQLFEIYQTYFDARLEMQSNLIKRRIEIQKLLEDEEWKLIIENAALPTDKLRNQIEKKDNKEDDKVDKFLAKL